MNSYELNYTKAHQDAMLKESMTAQSLREARMGQPRMGQRIIGDTGEALEAAGGWLKQRGSAQRDYASMGSGLSVPR